MLRCLMLVVLVLLTLSPSPATAADELAGVYRIEGHTAEGARYGGWTELQRIYVWWFWGNRRAYYLKARYGGSAAAEGWPAGQPRTFDTVAFREAGVLSFSVSSGGTGIIAALGNRSSSSSAFEGRFDIRNTGRERQLVGRYGRLPAGETWGDNLARPDVTSISPSTFTLPFPPDEAGEELILPGEPSDGTEIHRNVVIRGEALPRNLTARDISIAPGIEVVAIRSVNPQRTRLSVDLAVSWQARPGDHDVQVASATGEDLLTIRHPNSSIAVGGEIRHFGDPGHLVLHVPGSGSQRVRITSTSGRIGVKRALQVVGYLAAGRGELTVTLQGGSYYHLIIEDAEPTYTVRVERAD